MKAKFLISNADLSVLHANYVRRACFLKSFPNDNGSSYARQAWNKNCVNEFFNKRLFQFKLRIFTRLFVEAYLENWCHCRLDSTAINYYNGR